MKYLKDILYKVAVDSIIGSTDILVGNIEFDSRIIKSESLFVAQKGLTFDGHRFISKAVNDGAITIVCEKFPIKTESHVTYVRVRDSDVALSIIAANFYGNPSEKLKLVGITGTNGKTTIATLLYKLFKRAGHKAGLLSTIKIMIDDKELETSHTTPDSITINRVLSAMVEMDTEYCFMEVSSHGIQQKRTAGLSFAGGVFTNLTHDHLDYHDSFAQYRDVKKSFFDSLPRSAFALVNIDDKNGSVMIQNTKAKTYTYALKNMANYRLKILENQFDGLLLHIQNQEVWVKLIGEFNAYNLLAIYATSNLLGLDRLNILSLIMYLIIRLI